MRAQKCNACFDNSSDIFKMLWEAAAGAPCAASGITLASDW
jgi:hypothetical protein